MRLFAYKLKHDKGFAPNPFGGYLTLATCKPLIRKHKKIGDWIAGFTSKSLCGDKVGEERLIYLMRIDEKLTYADYWCDHRFSDKKAAEKSDIRIEVLGDNIYQPLNNGSYKKIGSKYHDELWLQEKDIRGGYVLISSIFYYFGAEPLVIPSEYRIKVPKAQSAHGSRTYNNVLAQDFIDFVINGRTAGMYCHPYTWKETDKSWMKDESYTK